MVERRVVGNKLRLARNVVVNTNTNPWQLRDSERMKVGDKLTTRNFGTGTLGFAASEHVNVAVCVLPGTELSFADAVSCAPKSLLAWRNRLINHRTAIFRQINKEELRAHHDAIGFPEGQRRARAQ